MNRIRQLFITFAVLTSATAIAQAPLLLNYHQIGVNTLFTHAPSPDTLNRHVQNLKANGYHLSRAGTFQHDLRRNGRRVALLTFDDGFKSVIDNAFPVLNDNGVTATVFVIAELIGEEDYLRATDLQFLQAHGWEIGNHTLTHAALTDLRPESIRHEIETTNQILSAITGERPACVAYPFGLHDAVVREIVSELNECAYTTAPHIAHEDSDPFTIPRPPLSGLDDRALEYGERGTSLTMSVVGLSMLTWPFPDDAPINSPSGLWTPTTYRTLGDGRYGALVGFDGVRHELSFREGPWALHLAHGRGAYRNHAVGIARNFGDLTVAGTFIAGEGPGAGISFDFGNRTEAWAYYTLSGGLHAGIRLVPIDYTSLTLTWHHGARRFAGEATIPVPFLPGEGYPLRATVGFEQFVYAQLSFRAGGNTVAVRADTDGVMGLNVDMRW